MHESRLMLRVFLFLRGNRIQRIYWQVVFDQAAMYGHKLGDATHTSQSPYSSDFICAFIIVPL
jgi:hypothetical protein